MSRLTYWLAAALLLTCAPRCFAAARSDSLRTFDVGQLRLTIDDYGEIGLVGPPGTVGAEWPAGSGVEFLGKLGIWVAEADRDGVYSVSTTTGPREFRPAQRGVNGGGIFDQHDPSYPHIRYPDLGADEDGDGLFDEDPLDGLDNDEDGRVDEDAGAIADQHFRLLLTDDDPAILAESPDHRPLHVQLLIDAFQWSDPDFDDFVGLELTLRKPGSGMDGNVRVGVHLAAEVGRSSDSTRGGDDLPGFWRGEVPLEDGSKVSLAIAYIYDADTDGGDAPGMLGVVFVKEEQHFLRAEIAREVPGAITNFQWFDTEVDLNVPRSDAERAAFLDGEGVKAVPAAGDFRRAGRIELIAAPAVEHRPRFELMSPPWIWQERVGIVAGANEPDLIRNATAFVRSAYGAWFDRDGDPETGTNGHEVQSCYYPPIFSDLWYQDCADQSGLRHDEGGQPTLLRRTPVPFCKWVSRDCELEASRGFPECNHLKGLLPSEYWGCTGIDGREWQVRWLAPLPPPDLPPAAIVTLRRDDDTVVVSGRFESVDPQTLTLTRVDADHLPGQTWSGDDILDPTAQGHLFFRDPARGGGVRLYVLEGESDAGPVELFRGSIELGWQSDSRLHLSVFPTPANPKVRIGFSLAHAGRARVDVFDIRGRHVRTLQSGLAIEGPQEITWDGTDDRGGRLASGAYLVRLQSDEGQLVKRVVLLR